VVATDAKRDAHHRVMRWSHVLAWQVDRLYDSRKLFMASHQRVLERSFFGEEDSWPAFQMDAEAHFTLVAGWQLLRALLAFDGVDRLPATLSEHQLRLVRDGLEHWDEPNGRAATALGALGVEAKLHEWTSTGPGRLGGLVLDSVLRDWATAVYRDLLPWDPWAE